MKKLLSHTKTKGELTTYLAEKMIQNAHQNQHIVVAYGTRCISKPRRYALPNSEQEEADTKILLHAVDSTTSGATSIHIHSPDTDVLVLALRRYPNLCKDTSFMTGTGKKRRVIPLLPIVEALGPSKSAALPAFHALSGADNTGSFAGKGKVTCWKVFQEASEEIYEAMANLGTNVIPSEETFSELEKFVCQLCLPSKKISKVSDLRWSLFKQKQAQSEKLPPTGGALREAILQAHYQLLVGTMIHCQILKFHLLKGMAGSLKKIMGSYYD